MFEVKVNEHKCKVFQTNHKKEQKKLMIFENLCQEEQKALVTTEMTFSFSRYIAKIPLQKKVEVINKITQNIQVDSFGRKF